jgi:uncharacterized protein (TIGR02246 family)
MTTTTTPATAREGIAAANARFMEAFGRGDAAAVAACYTPGALLLPPQSEQLSGAGPIEAFWRGAMGMGIAAVRLESLEISEAGADGAIEVGRYVLQTRDGQEADRGKYMVAWRREADGWRLHRDIWNTSRAPAS